MRHALAQQDAEDIDPVGVVFVPVADDVPLGEHIPRQLQHLTVAALEGDAVAVPARASEQTWIVTHIRCGRLRARQPAPLVGERPVHRAIARAGQNLGDCACHLFKYILIKILAAKITKIPIHKPAKNHGHRRTFGHSLCTATFST